MKATSKKVKARRRGERVHVPLLDSRVKVFVSGGGLGAEISGVKGGREYSLWINTEEVRAICEQAVALGSNNRTDGEN